jgi:hypothetical protein
MDNVLETDSGEEIVPIEMQPYRPGAPGYIPPDEDEELPNVTKPIPQISQEQADFEAMLDREDLSETEALRRRKSRKAEMAQMLDRGIVATKLDTSFVPDHLEGFWSRNNKDDINSFLAVGAQVWRGGRGAHSQGDGTCVVGDLILMIIRKEDRALLEEVKNEKTLRKVGTAARPSAARAEYLELSRTNPGVPIHDASQHGIHRPTSKET